MKIEVELRFLFALRYKKLMIAVAGMAKIPMSNAPNPTHDPFPVFN